MVGVTCCVEVDDGTMAREAEVEHLEHAVGPQHHVLGLEIAMHDAGVVRAQERRGELLAERRDGGRRQALAVDPRAQRLALDPLHDDERRVGVLAEVVDGDDRGVVERGGGARLTQGLGQRVGAFATMERLDRDHPVEHRVARAEDVAEAAAADLAEDLEAPEPRGAGGRLRGRRGHLEMVLRKGAFLNAGPMLAGAPATRVSAVSATPSDTLPAKEQRIGRDGPGSRR